MSRESLSRYALDVAVLGIAFFACFRFALPLLEPEETRYAELARQMETSGSWIVPTMDGQPYLDKPPLLYWLEAAILRAFGDSVFVARLLPSFVAALTVWVVYRGGRMAGGIVAGLFSAAILIAMPDFLYRTPMLTMNGLLGLLTTASLIAAYRALTTSSQTKLWWTTSALLCGLGILTKGPIALALIVGPLCVTPFWDRRLRRSTVVEAIAFLSIAIGITLPWFVTVSLRHPEFPEYFFWKHHVERVVNPFDHAKPWWYYLPQLLLGTLPWTLFIGSAIVATIRKKAANSAIVFGLSSVLIGTVLFSISGSKRPVYLVPIYPPLALATGTWLTTVLPINGRRLGFGLIGWSRLVAIVSFAIIAGMMSFLPSYHKLFSAGPILKSINSENRVWAVPYSSPAASFALKRIVPAASFEEMNVIEMSTHEAIVFVVPPRYSREASERLSGDWDRIENGEVVLFMRPAIP